MPLQSVQKINQNTYLGFWYLTESAAALMHQLKKLAPATLALPDFTSTSRQQQWLAARLLVYTLLQEFTPELILLGTDSLGKPYLENSNYNLSISHTATHVAVLLSNRFEVGIDIESIHPKVLRVKEKFMTIDELIAAGDSLLKTIIYWCTKETLYKLYGRKKLIFKEHLGVKPFVLKDSGTLEASINTPGFQKDYLVYYEKKEDYLLTYCLNKSTD